VDAASASRRVEEEKLPGPEFSMLMRSGTTDTVALSESSATEKGGGLCVPGRTQGNIIYVPGGSGCGAKAWGGSRRRSQREAGQAAAIGEVCRREDGLQMNRH
jgi:hypothetical protein